MAFGLCVVGFGCEEKPRPWGSGDGPAEVLAPPSRQAAAVDTPDAESGSESDLAQETQGSQGATTSFAAASAFVAPRAVAEGDEPSVTPGGGWVRCHEGLVLSGDPLKDVTRLGVMCGPSNGMRRKTRQAVVGVLDEGAPPVTVQVRLMRGACYRVFAASDENVRDLEVTLRSSRDATIASDHVGGRLSIVQPDRPFCSLEDDVATLQVRAVRGRGRFAAEVWALGERKRKGDAVDGPVDETPQDDAP